MSCFNHLLLFLLAFIVFFFFLLLLIIRPVEDALFFLCVSNILFDFFFSFSSSIWWHSLTSCNGKNRFLPAHQWWMLWPNRGPCWRTSSGHALAWLLRTTWTWSTSEKCLSGNSESSVSQELNLRCNDSRIFVVKCDEF